MERMLRQSLSIALLIGASVMYAGQTPRDPNKRPVTTSLKPRPQSLNGARKVAGEAPGDGLTHLPDLDTLNGNIWVAFEYQRTFRPNALARTLFGDFVVNVPATTTTTGTSTDCKNPCGSATLLVQGRDANNFAPEANALRAEDLYLPSDFNGTLTLKPSISTFIVDFNGRIGFDNWVQGLYLRVYAPFVHTRWNMNMTENIINKGAISSENVNSASEYFAGKAPSYAGQPFVDKASPLNYHRINTAATGTTTVTDDKCATTCGAEVINGFGEVRAELGWDFMCDGDYHIGLYLAGAAPTGTKPTAKLLFSPLVGNGRHWELGGGLTAHWVFWRNESEENHAGIYFDGMVTHLFKAREQRVFDLKNHTLSRYQLAARMDTPAVADLAGAPMKGSFDNPPLAPFTTVEKQYSHELTPIANLTAQDVNVSIAAQVDLTAWVNFTAGGFTWDIGYNLFLQTCEKFDCVAKCGPLLATDKNKWVIRGRSQAYGVGTADNALYPLSFSDSTATLNHGPASTTNYYLNEGIDNAALFATNTGQGAAGKQYLKALRGSNANPVLDATHLSAPPIFLKLEDIDMQKGSQKLTNKVWTYLGYQFDREGVVPFIGIGGEAEFAKGPSCKPECPPTTTTTKDCGTCTDSGISQWGVFAKVGVQFD